MLIENILKQNNKCIKYKKARIQQTKIESIVTVKLQISTNILKE